MGVGASLIKFVFGGHIFLIPFSESCLYDFCTLQPLLFSCRCSVIFLCPGLRRALVKGARTRGSGYSGLHVWFKFLVDVVSFWLCSCMLTFWSSVLSRGLEFKFAIFRALSLRPSLEGSLQTASLPAEICYDRPGHRIHILWPVQRRPSAAQKIAGNETKKTLNLNP